MKAFRATVQQFLDHGGAELARFHMLEAGAITVDVTQAEVNWDTYFALEQMDNLLCIIVLDDDKQMLGYVAGTSQPSIHNKGALEFLASAYYTRPEFRQQGVSALLLDALASVCKQVGVHEINYVVSERAPHTAEFVKAKGFVKSETTYTLKVIEDE